MKQSINQINTRNPVSHVDINRHTLEGYVVDEATIPRMFETYRHYICQWIDEVEGTVVFDEVRSVDYTGTGFQLIITLYYIESN